MVRFAMNLRPLLTNSHYDIHVFTYEKYHTFFTGVSQKRDRYPKGDRRRKPIDALRYSG